MERAYCCHSCKKRFVGTASRSGIHVTCSHCHRVSYAESAEIRTHDISPQPDEYESGQDYLEAVREYAGTIDGYYSALNAERAL